MQKKPFDDIKLNYKIWLTGKDNKGLLGDGKWKILEAIEEYQSLTAATKHLGLTYRRTWGDLKRIEKELGFPLLEKTRGGKKGGQTSLTPEGKKLVAAFRNFHSKIDGMIEDAFIDFQKDLKG